MNSEIITLVLKYAVPAILGIGIVSIWVESLRKVLREAAEVLVKLDDALDDGNVTKEEIAEIVKESKDVWTAIKTFGKK